MVFHCASHVKSWVSHGVHTDFDVALLDVHDCILNCLRHLHALHKHWESATGERADRDFLTRSKALSGIDDAHFVQFVRQLFSLGHSVVILLAQCLQLSHKLCDLADKLIVLDIILAILHMVASEHGDLPQARILLPLEKVHFLEQFLLVELQLTHRHLLY